MGGGGLSGNETHFGHCPVEQANVFAFLLLSQLGFSNFPRASAPDAHV